MIIYLNDILTYLTVHGDLNHVTILSMKISRLVSSSSERLFLYLGNYINSFDFLSNNTDVKIRGAKRKFLCIIVKNVKKEKSCSMDFYYIYFLIRNKSHCLPFCQLASLTIISIRRKKREK